MPMSLGIPYGSRLGARMTRSVGGVGVLQVYPTPAQVGYSICFVPHPDKPGNDRSGKLLLILSPSQGESSGRTNLETGHFLQC